jgi:NAD(P)H-hydrate epimerase
MSGAIALAGMATLRGGAGLVQLAVPDACLDTVASFEPSYMTLPLACDRAGRIAIAAKDTISQFAGDSTCLACGPGLGRTDELTELVAWMYQSLEQPIVFDADALNALAAHSRRLADPGGPRIVTPHPGEFRRLIADGKPPPDELPARAVELAAQHGIIVVLKGHHTLITDGQRQARNTTGNPGMATGGSGDVLTGLITALVCQGLDAFEAAQLAVHIHGLAGDLAAEELGQVPLMASDLIRYLPGAFWQLENNP